MLQVSVLLLTLVALPPQGQPQTASGDEQKLEMKSYDEGSMRCEPVAVFDARYWYLEEQPGVHPSELQMRWRISGFRMPKIARYGQIILTEAVTDTGQVLFDPNSYTEEQRTQTSPPNLPPNRLKYTGVLLPMRLDSPSREAKSLRLRGSVRVILAEESEEITIDNPRQYVGQNLKHDRLAELGIEVRVVPREELEGPAASASIGKQIALEFVKGEEHIKSVDFYNGWMRAIQVRDRNVNTTTGVQAKAYNFGADWLTDQCQLVLTVFPEIEEKTLPIEYDALELP